MKRALSCFPLLLYYYTSAAASTAVHYRVALKFHRLARRTLALQLAARADLHAAQLRFSLP
jgi:hypothetical protein